MVIGDKLWYIHKNVNGCDGCEIQKDGEYGKNLRFA